MIMIKKYHKSLVGHRKRLVGLGLFLFVLSFTFSAAWALHFDPGTRNARANAINTTLGVGATLCFFNGTVPVSCAAANGTYAVNITLPTPYLTAASGGVIGMAGSWTGTSIANTTVNYFRFFDSSAVCRVQGNVTITGGGGEITLDNPNLTDTQTVNVSTFTINEGNQ